MSSAPLAADVSAWKLFVTALLVVLNGFFVAAEFALVKVRGARVEALARKGNSHARMVVQILGNLSLYLSACQLGMTLASLALGWLAEPAVATMLLAGAERLGFAIHDGPAIHIVALVLALTVITILHMTIGEQAPKVFAIQKAEPMALFVAYPLFVFTVVLRPFIWFINAISNALLQLVGLSGTGEHEEVHNVDELRAVLRAATRAGHISSRQRAFGENILGLMRLEVRHIMLPRVDLVYLSTSKSTADNLETVKSSGHSRFLLCDEDPDNVLGMIHVKDLFAALLAHGNELDLKSVRRSIETVPDTQRISQLILELQKVQRQCAVVVDEHGTTVGMAFLEDALEEIVGPLHDEFDQKVPWIDNAAKGVVEMAGSVPLPEAADLLGLEVSSDSDTVGGYVTQELGRLPKEGETLEIEQYRVTVTAMSKRRVARVRFETPTTDPAKPPA